MTTCLSRQSAESPGSKRCTPIAVRFDRKITQLTPELLTATSSVAHPIARRNPDNGRIGLCLSPNRVTGIAGMGGDEAFDLLGELFAHATQRKYVYRHKWRTGDMVI